MPPPFSGMAKANSLLETIVQHPGSTQTLSPPQWAGFGLTSTPPVTVWRSIGLLEMVWLQNNDSSIIVKIELQSLIITTYTYMYLSFQLAVHWPTAI